MISFGWCSCARRSTSSKSISASSRRTPYCTALNHLPEIDGARAVGQVAAGGQRHAEEGVARLQQRQIDGAVGLRAGMRLHVGEGAAEQLLRPLDRERPRRRRRTRSRRSSACRDSPRRTCWSAPSPAPRARRARRCSPRRSARCGPAGGASSPAMAAAISGSVCASGSREEAIVQAVAGRGWTTLDIVSSRLRLQSGFDSLSTRRRWRPPSNGVVEEDAQAVARHLGADHPSAEADDVGIVVLPRKPCALRIVDQGGANLRKAIGGDADADAAAADQDAARRPAPPAARAPSRSRSRDSPPDRQPSAPRSTMVAAVRPQLLLEDLLQLEAGVVAGQPNALVIHGDRARACSE